MSFAWLVLALWYSGLLFVALLVLHLLGFRVFVWLSRDECAVVERLAKYNRVLDDGVHMMIPFIEHLRTVDWHCAGEHRDGKETELVHRGAVLSTRERIFDTRTVAATSSDCVLLHVNPVVWYQITQAHNAVYCIDNLFESLYQQTQTVVREAVLGKPWRHMLTGQGHAELKEAIRIISVELQGIDVPAVLREANEAAACQQREAEARVAVAEADGAARLLTAKTDSEVALVMMDVDAKERRTRAQACHDAMETLNIGANEYTQLERVHAWQTVIAAGAATNMVVPYDAATLVGTAQMLLRRSSVSAAPPKALS